MLVGSLLTILVLSVLQLGLVLLVRNTVLDAAAEGARYGALADNSPADGVTRTRALITTAIGAGYATSIRASTGTFDGQPVDTITVNAPLPLIGLIGLPRAVEVTGHAAIETLP